MKRFESYLRKPYRVGADGPDYFDCYGLVRDVSARFFDKTLPDIHRKDSDSLKTIIRALSETNEEWKNYRKVRYPKDGDIVRMIKGTSPLHMGIWVGGKVLHTHQGVGVCWDDVLLVKVKGWIPEYWRER